ncbi:meiotic kinetochore factor [Homo sapiens]|uniref:Meiosis-specific kinetochore protein n=1 Tax=Homo sapiens TaxID=9606 RepID=MEIKN_HUMAN|nr:meiosis-specific kinetochore protein [Homo sapiens]A0A087WXM9.2 RecName: Full=Meiosis-specific kinetochore protein [Homo sapiens]KAI2538739.1 meiotic kinetochore factor [Homo sapiens]KAI4022510.1 meiotic kinetochore factor [Homo sapiens]BAP91162.1 Meikin [Homo sapiens]|eukprot:NP_001290551.1 meiosis-specific kinetochore protein [Homo sapiens]
MWPLRVYTRKKREGQRLNLTPTPDLGSPAKAEAPPGSKRKGKVHGLSKIAEKAERSRQGGSGSGPFSPRLGVTGEKSLQENRSSEDTQDEKIASLRESVTDDLQVDSSSSNSELVSGLSLHHGMASSLLSYSVTDSYAEYKSFEESFPSPELFRKSDYLDWECPNLEEHMQWKNSTLLDTSKAVAIEKAPQFSNVSAIFSTSSEDYQKCHRKTVMTVADQNVSPKAKCASNSESDNAACEILLAEKTCPSTPEKTKKKKTNSSTPGKKNRGLLTSTPSSETAGFVIDLSSVQKASFEELFPNVSNYVNSNEIVPVSSLQENSSNEFPANASEICCIIRTSPGTRQVKNKGVIVKKKKYSLPKDTPQDIIIKMA